MLIAPFFRGLARHLHLACLALIAATASVCAQTYTPSADDSFDPNIDGNVFAIVKQEGDGKLIIAGQFSNVSPNGGITFPRTNIARFNADGSLDTDFNLSVNGAIRTAIVQPDGKVLIGGDFTTVSNEAHPYLARINKDGTVDSTFKAGVAKSKAIFVTPQVLALALQTDGSIVIGGTFGSVVSTNGSTTEIKNLARLSSAGNVDATYKPDPNAMVTALALHEGGKMLVGGAFTAFTSPETTTRLRMARLNADGTVDSEFDPKANDGVLAITVQADGKILLGGYFTTLQPRGDDTAATRSHIGRLNHDGTLDSEFYPTFGGNVLAICAAPDGSIFVGGRFTQVYTRGDVTATRGYSARLLYDGTLDENYNPAVNSDVNAIVIQSDGKAVLGGSFTRAQPPSLNAEVVRNRVARVLPSGSLDTAFTLDPSGRILASVTQTDGKIVVAGSFTNIGGLTRNYIARLNADGSVDTSYNPIFNGRIYALGYQSGDNKVIVGGAFTKVGATNQESDRNHIARLNSNGSVDSEFNPNIDGSVGSIVLQTDGKILVGGSFNTVHPFGTSDDVIRNYILRLNINGTLDSDFDPNPNSTVTGIGLQSDGKIILVGSFTSLQPNDTATTGTPTTRYYIARVLTTGKVDTNYNPQANYPIQSVVIQSDDKAVIGGRFTAFLPPNATDAVERHYLARVNTDSQIDSSFDPHPNSWVLSLALQTDGSILAGGIFTTFQPAGDSDWTLRKYVGRLTSAGKVDASFNLDLNELVTNRVDSIVVQAYGTNKGDILIGGTFISTQPIGSTSRVLRNKFMRVKSSGLLDVAFDPGAGGSTSAIVKAIALQTDGKMVVAGNFSDLGGTASTNIARFTPEGTTDASFNLALSADGTVNAVAVRANGVISPTQLGGFTWLNSSGNLVTSFIPKYTDGTTTTLISTRGRINASLTLSDGSIIVAGSFSDLTNTTSGNILHFKADGSLDANFKVTVNAAVYAMALQSDGKLLLGGAFTTVNDATRHYLARVGITDGSLDTSYDPAPDSTVYSLLLLSDDSAIIGGAFSNLYPNSATDATVRAHMAKIAKGGTIDSTFNPNLNGVVYTLALQSDKILAGGSFTSVEPNSDTTTTTRNYIARFQSDGNVDKSFDPSANNAVLALVVQDDKILLAGSFTSLQPTVDGASKPVSARKTIARVNSDGTVDETFSAGTNGEVTSMIQTSDGNITIGGYFTTVTETDSTTVIARNHIARFNKAGKLDAQFNPDIAGYVTSISLGTNGSLLVGGQFTSLQPLGLVLVGGDFKQVGGLSAPYLTQLNGDGSVNSIFQPTPDGPVNAVTTLPDGSFIVGGTFTKIGGAARSGLARFKADSTLDTNFNPPTLTGGVNTLTVQTDGKVLVGVNGTTGLIRLNADGSRDTAFTAPSFVPAVAIALQPDGKIIVAGPGSGIATRILRLNATGATDNTFSTVSVNSGGDIQALTLQADGSILVAGSFTTIGGANIARLARLTSTGAVDTSFNPYPDNTVSALALQSDGRLLFGGSFTKVGTLNRVGLARIGNTAIATQTLAPSADGKTITWLRTGTSNQRSPGGEVVATTFEISSDGTTWSAADGGSGIGSRIGTTSSWQITNVSVPTTANVFLRVRGIVPSSAGKSVGVYETVRMVNLSSPVKGIAMTVVPVVSTVAWDETHYVWTVDSSGVLHIADIYSGAILDDSSTVLINGSSGRATAASSSRVANLSTRGTVAAGSPLIGGFAIAGTGSRTVLVRAVGPSLAMFGVTDALAVPQLRLYNNSTGAIIGSNNGWNDDATLAATFTRTGAFPFLAGNTDAALVTTLAPGGYSVQVLDGTGMSAGGTALVEIYDADSQGTARLVNLSSRATVLANGGIVGGLVVAGNAPRTMLVRGIGPSLTKYGVTGTMADPKIAVYDGDGVLVAINDNWNTSTLSTLSDTQYANAMASAAKGAGAFEFDTGSKDAALVITLPAGAYTVQLTSTTTTSGAAMIEVYELQ